MIANLIRKDGGLCRGVNLDISFRARIADKPERRLAVGFALPTRPTRLEPRPSPWPLRNMRVEPDLFQNVSWNQQAIKLTGFRFEGARTVAFGGEPEVGDGVGMIEGAPQPPHMGWGLIVGINAEEAG